MPPLVAIFRVAWDIAGSAFGSRQVLYERFFASDPLTRAHPERHLSEGRRRQARVGLPRPRRGMTPAERGPVVVALLVSLAVGTAGAELPGLTRLSHVSVSVDGAHTLDALSADDLVDRLVEGLARADPPVTVADGASDRIRLTVSVRPVSATTLRGFWLPFSGTYGVGALRLGVERVVTFPGPPRTFPAVVWQTERTVGGPWRATDGEIVRLVDAMLADLLEARRQTR